MAVLMGAGGWFKGDAYLKVFPESLSLLINTQELVRVMLYHKAPLRAAREIAGTVEVHAADADVLKVSPAKSVTDQGKAAELVVRAGVPGETTLIVKGSSQLGAHGEASVRVKVRVPRSPRSQEIVDAAQLEEIDDAG